MPKVGHVELQRTFHGKDGAGKEHYHYVSVDNRWFLHCPPILTAEGLRYPEKITITIDVSGKEEA